MKKVIRIAARVGLATAFALTAAVGLAGGPAQAADRAGINATCVANAEVGDNYMGGYCLNSGAVIAYQEHVTCTNGRTYHGPVVTSRNGEPLSKAFCGGVNNFVRSFWITHT